MTDRNDYTDHRDDTATITDRNGATVRIAVEYDAGRPYITAGRIGTDPVELPLAGAVDMIDAIAYTLRVALRNQ